MPPRLRSDAEGGVPGETSRAVEHVIRIDATPETVFSYFTDPARMVEWMGSEATIDPRPGGALRVDIHGGIATGKFVQVDPYWRLVFTWGWEQQFFGVAPETTAVEVSFTPDGEGTIVKLTHSRLPAGAEAFHQVGWENYFARLALVAAGADPGPDPLANFENTMRAMRDLSARDG